MNSTDELVNAWLLDKMKEEMRGEQWDTFFQEEHGSIDSVTVISSEMGWECGCYSEYTRDDSFILTAIMQSEKGPAFPYSYGYWRDIPEFIKELDVYREWKCSLDEYYDAEDAGRFDDI